MKDCEIILRRNPYYTDSEVMAAAETIRSADNWGDVENECNIIMQAAGITWAELYAEYHDIDAAGTLFERALDMAADFLGVELY